jgi:prepilin signal peptidase PulO-like enzyme (type II secretory pathway)
MFTTGSKLLIGSALAAALFALVYGVTQGGALGTIGLISAAAGLALLAGINAWVRDANVSAMDHEAFASSAAAQSTAGAGLWPLLAGIGATAMTLGLATYRAIFMLGLIALIAAAIEWMVQGWSERASADRGYNAHARNVLVDPLELPVAGAIGAGVVVYAFSRVMLGLPSKSSTVVAFAIVAALVVAVGAVLALKPRTSRSTLTGTFGLAVVALIAGGAVAGLNGEREIEPHHTTADLAEEGGCTAEETEADEHASQTVSNKANVAAEILFDGSALDVDLPGYDGRSAALTLPRSNPNNVLLRNQSDAPVRFVVDMHPRLDDNGQALGPEQICTALVKPDSVQLLTLEFARPSWAVKDEGGYAVTVPGSDARLDVVVP